MPQKKQTTQAQAQDTPAPEMAPPKKEVAPKPRTRTAQPKKESESTSAPKDAPKPRTSKPRTSGAEVSDAKQGEATQAKPAPRKRTTTAKKASPKQESEQVAAREEHLPVVALPAPAEPPLPVQADAQQGVQIAVPPVVFPTLERERRHFWGRVLFLLVIAALLALSVLILAYRPTKYSAYSHSVAFLYHEEQNTTQVLYDGKSCAENIAGKCVRSEHDSAGRVCAALIGDALYLVQGDEALRIAAPVLDFALSQNGRALVYRTGEQRLYYVQTGRKLKTSAVSTDTRDARYCLSPDGELLFYTYVKENEAGESKTHADVFSLSGKKPLLPHTTDMVPVAIADDFEHIFYFNAAGDLYYMDEDGEISLCRRRGESEMELLFDREFEELIVRDESGMALWQEGELTVLSGLKGAEYLFLLANQLAVYRELPCARQCLVRTLDENYYLKMGTHEQGVEMVYLDETELRTVGFIGVGESDPVVTDKGVYYLERITMKDEVRTQLFRCPIGQSEPQVLAFDVSSFQVNSDGSRLLYTDHLFALYAARVVGDKLDATRICDHVQAGSLCVSASNIFYYKSAEGTLYMSDNGKKPAPVSVQGSVQIDVHTAFFFVPSTPVSDGETVQPSYTVYTNHRNRREYKKVASGGIIRMLPYYNE